MCSGGHKRTSPSNNCVSTVVRWRSKTSSLAWGTIAFTSQSLLITVSLISYVRETFRRRRLSRAAPPRLTTHVLTPRAATKSCIFGATIAYRQPTRTNKHDLKQYPFPSAVLCNDEWTKRQKKRTHAYTTSVKTQICLKSARPLTTPSNIFCKFTLSASNSFVTPRLWYPCHAPPQRTP
ncbi:hypothetical protein BC835DRAFT_359199 [Cytidiella melzeri]|nr:hypothetical protein BC835DRAFT_359199 [Cytidiella melzeri]